MESHSDSGDSLVPALRIPFGISLERTSNHFLSARARRSDTIAHNVMTISNNYDDCRCKPVAVLEILDVTGSSRRADRKHSTGKEKIGPGAR